MRQIQLYINNKKVDLDDDNYILYNWSETELSNPSNTQNSYSKVITLKGTKRNNKVFGQLWNLERVQTYDEGDINASRRIPFRITFDGDNVFEEGYCKIQNIKMLNGVYYYEISLFGMIGNFLNNLATNYTDGSQKTLADLHYIYDNGEQSEEFNLDFNINLHTVQEAWHNLNVQHSKWSVINFANCYNGIPSSLDADKVLIDGVSGYSPFITTAKTQDGATYSPVANRIVAQTARQMSKDEVKDIRSYLLNPVVSVKKVLLAICNRMNNAGEFDNGYDVELDPTFFNNYNPYYENTWMTLTPITSIKTANQNKGEGSEQIIRSMTLFDVQRIGQTKRYIYNIDLQEPLSEWTDIDMDIKFGAQFPSTAYDKLYLKDYFSQRVNAYSIQAYAITDESMSHYENVVAGSNIVWLTSNNFRNIYAYFPYSQAIEQGLYTPKYLTDEVSVWSNDNARWKKKEGNDYHSLVYSRPSDTGQTFEEGIDTYNFKFTAPSGSKTLRVCVDMISKKNNYLPDEAYVLNSDYPPQYYTVSLYNYSLYCNIKGNSGYYSNKSISKQNLLTTNYSVKDWLLSYCKLFGLYIWYDKVTNKIHIDSRRTFYQRENRTDISEYIDLSKDYSIKPVFAESRYYNMTQDQISSDLADDYKTEFGKVYGMKTIDTGVDLDNSQKELMDLKLKSAIMTNKESVYNYKDKTIDGISYITPYLCDGFTYSLYKNGSTTGNNETIEMTKDPYTLSKLFEGEELVSGKPYADIIDKPLFEKSDKGTDGNSVLLFQDGWNYDLASYGYYLSDDIPAMDELNGKPTWIVTNNFTNKDYVAPLEEMPLFSRYWTEGGKHILFSLDFGSPRKLYIDDKIHHQERTLYDKFYGSYYGDLYDVNTKVLDCYFKPVNILSINDLRKFYWFNNSLWRLNKVTDYNPGNEFLVKAQFIKVQDVNNITSEIASNRLTVTITLDASAVSYFGGTIRGTIETSDYGYWTGYGDDLFSYPSGADTNAEVVIDVPANTGQTEHTYRYIVEAGDAAAGKVITQEAGYGKIKTVNFNLVNRSGKTLRLGCNLYAFAGYPYTYRTVQTNSSVDYSLPVPFSSTTAWAYDLSVEDAIGNTDGLHFYFYPGDGSAQIEAVGLDDFNELLEHLPYSKFQGGIMMVNNDD